MLTRSKASFFKPKTYIANCQSSQKEQTIVSVELADPKWHKAMVEAFQVLLANQTWKLVKPSHPIKVIGKNKCLESSIIHIVARGGYWLGLARFRDKI